MSKSKMEMKFVCPHCGQSFHVSQMRTSLCETLQSGYAPSRPSVPYPHIDPAPVPKNNLPFEMSKLSQEIVDDFS